MQFEQSLAWIEEQKDNLDTVIYNAAVDYYNKHNSKSNFIFDINESSKECYALSRGRDLCYDRPTIGFAYSLWYQGRRINSFLRYFAKVIYDSRDDGDITVFDLGAGTGAVQFACGIILSGFNHFGMNSPKIKVINVDTSPFMLDYNRSYLWPNLIKFYPIVSNIITEYSVNSWDQSVGNDSSNIWLTASYLFDHSENSDNLKLDFKSLLQKLQPTKILLSSSLNKKVFTNQLAEELKENEYVTVPVESSLIYSGVMTKTLEMRQWLNKNGCSLNGTPTWNEHAIYGLVLTSKSPYFGLNPKEEIDSLNLYVPPIKVRRDIVLNHHQHNAAAPDGKPTIIIGLLVVGKV